MIVRSPRRTRFTTVLNTFVEDGRLSLKAKGLLLFVLSKPDGWNITVRGLIALPELGTDGRDAVVSALQELETCDYLTRTRQRKADGTWEWTSIVTDEPDHDGKSAQETALQSSSHDGKSEIVGDVSETPTMTENPYTMSGKTVHGKPVHIVNTVTSNLPDTTSPIGDVPSAAQAPLAVQVNQALMNLHNAQNKVTGVGELFVLCFGHQPDYPRLGAVVKANGYAEVARQFTLLIGRPPADPLAYVQEVLNAKRKTAKANRGAATSTGGVLAESQVSVNGAGTGNSAGTPTKVNGKTARLVSADEERTDIYL